MAMAQELRTDRIVTCSMTAAKVQGFSRDEKNLLQKAVTGG